MSKIDQFETAAGIWGLTTLVCLFINPLVAVIPGLVTAFCIVKRLKK